MPDSSSGAKLAIAVAAVPLVVAKSRWLKAKPVLFVSVRPLITAMCDGSADWMVTTPLLNLKFESDRAD